MCRPCLDKAVGQSAAALSRCLAVAALVKRVHERLDVSLPWRQA